MLFTSKERDERLFRKGIALGFEKAIQAVGTHHDPGTWAHKQIVDKINSYRVMTLSMPDSFVDKVS